MKSYQKQSLKKNKTSYILFLEKNFYICQINIQQNNNSGFIATQSI